MFLGPVRTEKVSSRYQPRIQVTLRKRQNKNCKKDEDTDYLEIPEYLLIWYLLTLHVPFEREVSGPLEDHMSKNLVIWLMAMKLCPSYVLEFKIHSR